jgi:hypothetical protein
MGLNTGGIIFMSIAGTSIISLVIFCFYKVFKSERKNNV